MPRNSDLEELCRIEHSQRGPSWGNALLAALSDQPATLCDPQIEQGPDGFPYFGIALADGAQAASLDDILRFCTKQAYCGLVLFRDATRAEQPEWVFSLGDLWSLRMFGTIEGDPDDVAEIEPGPPEADESQQVLLASPSEAFLPQAMKQALTAFLKDVLDLPENPDVALVVAPQRRPARNLVPTVSASAFRDDAQREGVLAALGWFVPRGRGLMFWPGEWDGGTSPRRS